MTSSDLKLKIFRKIDGLEGADLNEFYGILSNFINGKSEVDDWASLSQEQQNGILNALDQVNANKGIPHEKVISKFRNNY